MSQDPVDLRDAETGEIERDIVVVEGRREPLAEITNTRVRVFDRAERATVQRRTRHELPESFEGAHRVR